MALTPEGRDAMAYWGAVVSSVAHRASTAELWDAIKGAAAEIPGGAPLPTLQAVNELRSIGAGMRNATEALTVTRDLAERSGLDQAITSSMITLTPWSRSPGVLDTLSNYLVRYQAKTIGPNGEAVVQWLSARYPGAQLPTTVGGLVTELAAIGLSSNSLASGQFDGVGDVQINAI